MTWPAYISGSLAIFMVVAMARSWATPDLVLMGGLTLLLTLGVVDHEAALAGFSSPAVLSIAALFVVAAGIRETGALDFIARHWLGRPKRTAEAQLRLMLPVSVMSAFLNNTPVVAMMVPLVMEWSRRTGGALGRLLMPLSYAAILGGGCTLIGSSTNLLIAGMAARELPGLELAIFDVAVLGVPVLILGMLYVLVASRWLLPQGDRDAAAGDNPREYTVTMRVQPGSPVVGQSVEEAGLRHLPGLYLAEIERGGHVLAAVDPSVRLQAEDRLLFAGVVDSVVDLRRIRGLVPATDQVDKLAGRPDRRLVEAVVAAQSTLVGRNAREIHFRTRYNAAIIAVHRQGARVRAKIGDIAFAPGDTLLLETQAGFRRTHRNDGNFALIAEVEGGAPRRHHRAWLSASILAMMVVLHVGGAVDLLSAALLAAGGMVLTGCLSLHEARRAVDLRVILAIAAAFGVGAALEQTGAAAALAQALVALGQPMGPVGILAAIYLATVLLTSLISNNAAAALMFPVAAAAAAQSGFDNPRPWLYVLMLAASASFCTPIGYQTNLMVLGPGGYRFADFLRFGLPLQVILGLCTLALAMCLWF